MVNQDFATQPPIMFLLSLSSLDGTVLVLARQGSFDSLTSSLLTGLLVIAGTGTWLSVLATKAPLYRGHLLRAAGVSAATVTASAWLAHGPLSSLELLALPTLAGLLLLLLSLQLLGVTLPAVRLGRAHVPALQVLWALGLLTEVGLQWIGASV